MNRRDFLAVAKETIVQFGKDDIGLLAAGLTYYVFFSLFPLILLVITLAGILVKPADAANFIFTNVAMIAPGSTQLLTGAVDKAFQNRNNAGLLAIIGIVTLMFSSSNAFGTLYKAINRAWRTEHRPSFLLDKLISVIMMVAAGLLFLLSLMVSTILTSTRAFTQSRFGHVPGDQIFWQLLTVIGSMALAFVILLLIYWFVPRIHVGWRDVWLAALIAAVAWTLLKELFSLYLGSSLVNYDAVYGTMGAVIALLTWIYISTLIVLGGAEFASETHRLYRLKAGVSANSGNPLEDARKVSVKSPWFSDK